jgi:hypothetical protein
MVQAALSERPRIFQPLCDLCGRPMAWKEVQGRVYFFSFENHSGLLLLCPACQGHETLPPGLRPLPDAMGPLALAYRYLREG